MSIKYVVSLVNSQSNEHKTDFFQTIYAVVKVINAVNHWLFSLILHSRGYYIYAEASDPRRPGDRARLLSPLVTGDTCVAFRFNMHGSQMGTLRVYGKLGSNEQVVWEHNTNTGDTWDGMQINIQTTAQFQVRRAIFDKY